MGSISHWIIDEADNMNKLYNNSNIKKGDNSNIKKGDNSYIKKGDNSNIKREITPI